MVAIILGEEKVCKRLAPWRGTSAKNQPSVSKYTAFKFDSQALYRGKVSVHKYIVLFSW